MPKAEDFDLNIGSNLNDKKKEITKFGNSNLTERKYKQDSDSDLIDVNYYSKAKSKFALV